MTKMNDHNVQCAGEYLVCAELCRRNITAALVLGNAPNIDVLATIDGQRQISIQVKTSRGNTQPLSWLVGNKTPNPSESFFYIFVNVWEDDGKQPEYFIVPSAKVKEKVNWNASAPKISLGEQASQYKSNWGIIRDYLNVV